MGNTCKPVAVSFQCMTKSLQIKKKREREQGKEYGKAKARPLITFLSSGVCLLPKHGHPAHLRAGVLQQGHVSQGPEAGPELVRPVKPHPLGRREMRVRSQGPPSIIMCVHTVTSGQNPHQGTFTYKHCTNSCLTVSYTYTLISSYCLLIHTFKHAPNIDIQPLVCTHRK